MAPSDPLTWIDKELETLAKANLRRYLTVREGPQSGARISLDGRELINFGSNDYLGLANRCLLPGIQRALDHGGWGSGASPLITGRGRLHAELELALAKFEKTEAALLFPSGFVANLATVTALVGPQDVIFSDQNNHASIIDGCRLSRARVVIFNHADTDHLRQLLCQATSCRRRLIVTDSLFSMDGDFAPLESLAQLAEEHDAMLMVDEAHATGVFGQHGRGVCESLGVEDGVHLRVGTLSKGLGSIGGFVAARRQVIDWLANQARGYFFSTAPPEAVAAAGLMALEIVTNEPQRRCQLLAQAAVLRDRLIQNGWQTGPSASQIVPVYLGDADSTMALAQRLQKAGLFVPGIRPPSVREGRCLLRISLTFDHRDEMIGRLVEELGTNRAGCHGESSKQN